MDRVAIDIEIAFRSVHGEAVATLVRMFGDLSTAEDAVQDAFVVAADRWASTGIPENPAGWIVTTAKRRAIDLLRRSKRGRELEHEASSGRATWSSIDVEAAAVPDDQLRLIFMCCHPALRPEHRVALTLRLVGGLSVREIARGFLVAEETMKKRLTRAKHKIAAAKIPFRVPDPDELPARVQSVLAVVYLIYTAGHDDPDRSALRAEAIRLARLLCSLMPDEPEADGLLALVLLSESRQTARFQMGEVVLLADQDRSLWDRDAIAEGHALVRACVRRNRPGPYQLQAAIQAVHCAARSVSTTDWPQIVSIYDQLLRITSTPIVRLNRAIAVGEARGAEAGLAAVEELAESLDAYHLFHVAQGTFHLRLGDRIAAERAFQRAALLAPSERERHQIERELETMPRQ